MNALVFLHQLLIGPLELLLETVYGVFNGIFANSGAALIPLSLAVNFLLLPFYLRADAIQRQERDKQAAMAPGLAHIRKCFKGDERYMMIQTWYRQNRYKPVYALRSALPLLLQVPFFIAAYRFLSDLPDLSGAAFGPIRDLSAPDGLLEMGGRSIHLLPILMTLINVLSTEIYAKDLSLRDRLRLHAMALVFLVLLYRSASGLVIYWTLNNLFSLVKNLIQSAKNRAFARCAAMSSLGAAALAYALFVYRNTDLNQLLLIIVGLLFQIPTLRRLTGKRFSFRPAIESSPKPDGRLFVLGCVYLTVLTGLLIPSAVVGSSPAEFVAASDFHTPLLYVLYALTLAAGAFLVWPGLVYCLAEDRVRNALGAGVWLLGGAFTVNYMFFGTHLGNLSSELKYEIDFVFDAKACLINAEVLLLLCAVLLILWVKKRRVVKAVYPVLILAVMGMSLQNAVGIQSAVPRIRETVVRDDDEKASFTLSRKGRNVIVFMLDRGISAYVPYMLRENPELERQFAGFTWYPNALSYGTRTNTASPALFGGYEYVPEALNGRSDERLEDKQNEALKVMPVLFDDAGYDVTVCDPPYAGYSWVPDLSIYDAYEDIKTYNTGSGQFYDSRESLAAKQQIWRRNIFCYSVMKASPLLLQSGLYQNGTYYNPHWMDSSLRQVQYVQGTSIAIGVWESFMNAYAALGALPSMTRISSGDAGTFLMMGNDTTHNCILLQEPQYEPSLVVDNRRYDSEHAGRFVIDGREMKVDTAYQMSHYQSNMAAFICLGRWFDYLRDEGVYDNTRIILAADHGWSLEQFPDMIFGERDPEKTIYNPEDAMAYNPLLMVKDFGETEFRVDRRFMTNADVPALAFEGLIENPKNPFTGAAIDDAAKYVPEQHVFYTDYWGVEENNGTVFLPGIWYSLTGQDVFDMSGWKKIE